MKNKSSEWWENFSTFLTPLQWALVATSASLIIIIVFGVLPLLSPEKYSERLRRQNFSYVTQIEELNKIENSLNNFIDFINLQKEKLKETEDTLNELKKEKDIIEPVIRSQREIINSIFEIQEKRNKRKIWKERIIGFLLGIFSSLFSSSIWKISKFYRRKRSD